MRYIARTSLLLGLLLILILAPNVTAFELPSENANVYVQTSGPAAGINIGDYYTSADGAAGNHAVQVYVPCGWAPLLPLTFALYDPESTGPNPVVGPGSPSAEDEIRNGVADDTTFTLTTPNGTVINEVYTPLGGTNGLWVELLTTTITASGCGVYTLNTSTGIDDDNAWRLRVGHDPDCSPTPGTCSLLGAASSALMGDADLQDDGDGVPGTGDELVISFTQLSQQHQAIACTDYFMFVDGDTPTIALHNFDFDDFGGGNPAVSIRYFPPAGSDLDPTGVGIPGTESGRTAWNGSPDNPGNTPNPPRTGDVFNIDLDDIGWWRTQVCMDTNNQYIFEGLEGEPIFFEQPPFPIMTVNKDNGVTEVSADGQQVTYTINYANTNPVGAPTFGGAAINVQIVDTLPTGATFVSCSGGCINNGGSVTWNIGIVPAPPNAGNSGSLALTVNLASANNGDQHVNNVSLEFTDLLGSNYPPVTDQDIDIVTGTPSGNPPNDPGDPGDPNNPPPDGNTPPGDTPGSNTPPSSGSGAGLTIDKSTDSPFSSSGETVNFQIVITNTSDTTATNVGMTDNLPDGLENISATTTTGTVTVNGQQVQLSGASIPARSAMTVTVNATISQSVAVPFQITNTACLTGSAVCDNVTLLSVTTLPATGESPWSRVRIALIVALAMSVSGLAVSGGIRATHRPSQ